MTGLTRDELRPRAARAVQDWGLLLAQKLSVDDSWRLLLDASVTVAQAEYTPDEIAEMFRRLAADIDAGGLESSKKELN